MSQARILVVDDEETIRKLLVTRFSREGWIADSAEDAKMGIEKAIKSDPTVIISDIKMPGMDGFQFMEALREKGVTCPVVIVTGHGEKECAIEAVHKGAFDYLEKPFDMDEIAQVVKRAHEREMLRRSNTKLMKDLEEANKKLNVQLEVKTELLDRVEKESGGSDDILLGKSEHIKGLKEMIGTIAGSFSGDHDPVILVTGESGVGKEVVARYIHHVLFTKDSKNKSFVAINCAAFPEHLLESELFGYEKGAFTGAVTRKLGLFELANGGTLFLDEIGEMDLKMQAKLLRAIQERVIRRLGGTADISVRPHIIAATNRDLSKMVGEKTFREDLYYRLNTIPISVAPLRSRPEDIELLAGSFLKKFSSGKNKRFNGFSNSAIKALMAYSWPGNVRELRSVIERAVILEKGPHVELSHLRQEHLQAVKADVGKSASYPVNDANGSKEGSVLQFPQGNSTTTNSSGGGTSITDQLLDKGLTNLRKEMDDGFVKQVLLECLTVDQGNVSSVARKLKLDRANLLRMLKRFAIQPELFRQKKAG